MENVNNPDAYHEGGRVVFTYLNGFACDSIELPGQNANSNTKLNAGADINAVQAVLSSNPLSLPPDQLQHAIEVAGKLMTVYCAGTCTRIYYQNNANIPAELEMDIKGQDLTMLQKIQTFLNKAIPDHSEDYPTEVIVSVFKKLKDPAVWKAIELLAEKLLQEGNSSFNRFYIEDTLMKAGISITRPHAKSGYSLGVHEDDSEKPTIYEPKPVAFNANNFSPLDIVVRDFLKNIKKDWPEEELLTATSYLHEVYKKYG